MPQAGLPQEASSAPASQRGVLGLVLWASVCTAAALAGSLFTGPALAAWYAGLAKPSWTPPDWVFGPVWTALYGMMAAAAWLVWRRPGGRGSALWLFGAQLVANAAWPGVFFGLESPGAAFVLIVVLWALIAATTRSFWRRDRLAAALLLPYLLWVSYAAALNLALWRLNR